MHCLFHCPQCEETASPDKATQGTTAKAAVRFLSFDTIRNSLSDERGKLSASRGILAGMVAGAVESMTVVTPTERVKTALSVSCPDKYCNRQLIKMQNRRRQNHPPIPLRPPRLSNPHQRVRNLRTLPRPHLDHSKAISNIRRSHGHLQHPQRNR